MEKVVLAILEKLRSTESLDAAELDRIVRQRSAQAHDGRRVFAKKHILPYYLRVRSENNELWRSWNVDAHLDDLFVKSLQMKPRRSASGVATITVITKPWPCANNCIYCPNDPAMPKSYLSNEPACQRAERNLFHPYLQVASRLRTLDQMGHATDKIELIVLGGTWLDYPPDYRTWFVAELFRALNDSAKQRAEALESPDEFAADIHAHDLSDLVDLHRANERADHRVVGLVVETRPDTISIPALIHLRELGCTKIQMGVQSVNDELLKLNGRHETTEVIERAFTLARLFGFKIHAHFMLNLLGATPESDVSDYRTFVTAPAFQPDEVKLYPCALVDATKLVEHYKDGSWSPYTEEELIDVLGKNMLDTPPFTRVSRMIRDISAHDILAGNKKTNLRQLVDESLAGREADVQEIRFREIATKPVSIQELVMKETRYETSATIEYFLQWVSPDNKIAGFLRLSLPDPDAIEKLEAKLPITVLEAMIREVHVYGFATRLDKEGPSAQHRGLGRALVERACDIARKAGYQRINVISAVGTRPYYRKLGFEDKGLYQRKNLAEDL